MGPYIIGGHAAVDKMEWNRIGFDKLIWSRYTMGDDESR